MLADKECANVAAGFALRNDEETTMFPFCFDRRDRN
jgi:hypothetical protein